MVRSFYSNKFVNVFENKIRTLSFDVPKFTTLGGSLNYYSQDPEMLFTNVNTPFIRYVFTANTHSLSGAVEIIHKTYKLDFNTYKRYLPSVANQQTKTKNENDFSTQKETVLDKDYTCAIRWI